MDLSGRRAINEWMRAHGGILTTRDANSLGIDRGKLSRAHAAGELTRVRHRVYLPSGLAPDWRMELAADLAACLAQAWAAYTAALALHRLSVPGLSIQRELVVVGSARPTVASEVVVHRTAALDPIDRAIVDGIPTTTAVRALIDMSRRLTVTQRLLLLDDAVMRDVVDRTLMHDRASALWRGRKGVRTLIMATAPGAEQRFRSRLEKLGAPLLVEAGLTDMRCNVVPRRAPGAGITDVVSEVDRIIVDWDGLRFHSGPRSRQRDNEKSNAVVLGGYTALRFTWQDLTRRPRYVVETVRRAVQRSAAPGV